MEGFSGVWYSGSVLKTCLPIYQAAGYCIKTYQMYYDFVVGCFHLELRQWEVVT